MYFGRDSSANPTYPYVGAHSFSAGTLDITTVQDLTAFPDFNAAYIAGVPPGVVATPISNGGGGVPDAMGLTFTKSSSITIIGAEFALSPLQQQAAAGYNLFMLFYSSSSGWSKSIPFETIGSVANLLIPIGSGTLMYVTPHTHSEAAHCCMCVSVRGT